MRSTILSIIAIVGFGLHGYSQEAQQEKTIDKENQISAEWIKKQSVFNQQNKTRTLRVNLKGLSKNVQGEVKDEILTYKEKIISLSLDESSQIMEVVHISILQKEKILKILEQHGVNSSSIIIYL